MRSSVLINNYNNAPYLEHCLASVFLQRPQPDEIIFYDDGSSDGSLVIANKYRERLRIIAGQRGEGTAIQNQARAIATAFKESTGDVVFLLDGDDGFLPGKMDAYLRAFREAPEAIMVQSPLLKIDHRGYLIGFEYEIERHQADYREHIYSAHELNVYYPTSSLAFRRSYLEKRLPLNPPAVLHVWPDAQLALVAPLFGKVVALRQPYSEWRRHPRSHTVSKPHPIYRMVRFNQAYFNDFCRASGWAGITTWRSKSHLLRTLRHYLFPESCVQLSRSVRWAFMSERKKREMLLGPDLNVLNNYMLKRWRQ
ncbi:hypothetical protein CMV30_12340 [Nibricoccus aquaticus]|uniref:Glycosyltransferase 2-like domain-containing protein n=1 Tax=Nibricoccus aquaticus TaxID=2576891 RepID=A0A290QL58_9BACT|nr:glycosyltransferase [Nibricoccus aquaticus]ATC64682.1 hypothetical protein CMV30_12340 [Nibricoccus aquaticus]